MKLSDAARIFRTLGCEQRLALLTLLSNWCCLDSCCNGVEKAFTRASEELKISRSTLSHHFKELQAAGLITCERHGQSMTCKVNGEVLKDLQGLFGRQFFLSQLP